GAGAAQWVQGSPLPRPLRRRGVAADTAVADTAVVDTVVADTAVWPRMVGWAGTPWVGDSAVADSVAVDSRWLGTAGRGRLPSIAASFMAHASTAVFAALPSAAPSTPTA